MVYVRALTYTDLHVIKRSGTKWSINIQLGLLELDSSFTEK